MTWQPHSVTVLEGHRAWADDAPHPALAPWVSTFWTVQYGAGRHVIRTLPDACVDLTLELTGEPRAHVAGVQKVARVWEFDGPLHLVGARLLPGVAGLLGIDADQLRDEWSPLADFIDAGEVRQLLRAVAAGADRAARIGALEAFLGVRLLNRAPDARLTRAIDQVFARAGDVGVAELARHAGVHRRTLTRLFEAAVGVTPKRFARIVRFQAALRRLGHAGTWAALAAELGYHDQAHFIRDMRELFGATPTTALEQLARAAGTSAKPA